MCKAYVGLFENAHSAGIVMWLTDWDRRSEPERNESELMEKDGRQSDLQSYSGSVILAKEQPPNAKNLQAK